MIIKIVIDDGDRHIEWEGEVSTYNEAAEIFDKLYFGMDEQTLGIP